MRSVGDNGRVEMVALNDTGMPSLLRLLTIIALESTYKLEAVQVDCEVLRAELLSLVTNVPGVPEHGGEFPMCPRNPQADSLPCFLAPLLAPSSMLFEYREHCVE